MDNFDPYNLFLAIATNIPVLLKTAFVVQGHTYIYIYIYIIDSFEVCIYGRCIRLICFYKTQWNSYVVFTFDDHY